VSVADEDSIEYQYPVDNTFPPRYVTTAMEQFFTPTRPLRYDLLEESTHGAIPCTEVQLAVSVEDFLVYIWDWKELRAFLTGGVTPKFLWLTENAFLVVKESGHFFDFDKINDCVDVIFEDASGQEQELVLVHVDHEEISTGEAGIFWRAITTSNSVKLTIGNDVNLLRLPSGPLLSQFLRKSLSLQVLEFNGFHFKEEHCRALAALQRNDLEIKFRCCKLDPQDAEGTFIEWFRHNQVVTELGCCEMGSNFLSALSGNNSVKKLAIERELNCCDVDRNFLSALSGNNDVNKLTIARGSSAFAEEQIRFMSQALPGNMGIEHLSLNSNEISDENWSLLFRSLATHPRIKLVSVHTFGLRPPPPLSAARNTKRMNAILQMLHLNTVIHTIEVRDDFRDEAVYLNSIIPRLEMNRNCFEVQRQAVKRADPSVRPQLLGRALHVVRYNPNLVFQFLSENVPAFVRTEYEQEDSVISLQNHSAIVSGQKRKAPS
jgi:hypothetical protein